MCSIIKKVQSAIYILKELLQDKDIDNEENVKLMKLIYLVYIRARGLHPGHNFPENSPMADYAFTAMERGPVEDVVYNNIGVIRSKIKDQEASIDCFPEEEREIIARAIEAIRTKFGEQTTQSLVDFTHDSLTEWRKTAPYEVMKFANGYEEEIQALDNALADHAA